MATLDRIEKPTHLVVIPQSAALELWQGYVHALDVVEDGRDLHDCLSPAEMDSGTRTRPVRRSVMRPIYTKN